MPGKISPPPKQPGSRWPGFLINRSGLPFDDLTWNELWEFAGYLYPEAKITLREIQTAPLLQDVPYLAPPTISTAKQGKIKPRAVIRQLIFKFVEMVGLLFLAL